MGRKHWFLLDQDCIGQVADYGNRSVIVKLWNWAFTLFEACAYLSAKLCRNIIFHRSNVSMLTRTRRTKREKNAQWKTQIYWALIQQLFNMTFNNDSKVTESFSKVLQLMFLRMTHSRISEQVAQGQNMQIYSSSIEKRKCWFYRKTQCWKHLSAPVKTVLHKQAHVLPPRIAA